MEEEIALDYYVSDTGECPFVKWRERLPEKIRDLVTVRLARIRLGNFGDCKTVKNEKGLFELRMHMSPGFRIYFGKKGSKVVILLCGGHKGSQKKDISKELLAKVP